MGICPDPGSILNELCNAAQFSAIQPDASAIGASIQKDVRVVGEIKGFRDACAARTGFRLSVMILSLAGAYNVRSRFVRYLACADQGVYNRTKLAVVTPDACASSTHIDSLPSINA